MERRLSRVLTRNPSPQTENTVLHMAALSGKLKVFQALVDAGLKVGSKNKVRSFREREAEPGE